MLMCCHLVDLCVVMAASKVNLFKCYTECNTSFAFFMAFICSVPTYVYKKFCVFSIPFKSRILVFESQLMDLNQDCIMRVTSHV